MDQELLPEPTLGELARRLDTLERHIMSRLQEMDLRYQQRFDAQSLSVDAALASADRAVGKAEIAADKRFESVNEFRKTLADQTASFITRLEYDGAHEALVAKVDSSNTEQDAKFGGLSDRLGAIEGGLRAQARNQTLSIGALGVIIMLATLVLTVFR